jgi:hypothetical protein
MHRATVTGCALLEAPRDQGRDYPAPAGPLSPRSGPQRRRRQLSDS